MRHANDQVSSNMALRATSPASGMLLTFSVSLVLWLMIIIAAYGIFRWALPA